MSAEVIEHDHGLEHAHDHEDGEHGHDHTDDADAAMQPQPVPQSVGMALVPMVDGTDRIRVVFQSLNGSWVVFFDREHAINHAQQLLGMAYLPPVAPPEQIDAEAPASPSAPSIVPAGEPE